MNASSLPPVTPDTGDLLSFSPMQRTDLHEVYVIEESVFTSCWSYPSFLSSVDAGDDGWVLRDAAGKMLGYFIAMKVVDEMHLLKIAVDRSFQGKGYGRRLLEKAIALARDEKMVSMLLEVRPANTPAVSLYQKAGFSTIGVRKGYYTDTREDAWVMRLAL